MTVVEAEQEALSMWPCGVMEEMPSSRQELVLVYLKTFSGLIQVKTENQFLRMYDLKSQDLVQFN